MSFARPPNVSTILVPTIHFSGVSENNLLSQKRPAMPMNSSSDATGEGWLPHALPAYCPGIVTTGVGAPWPLSASTCST